MRDMIKDAGSGRKLLALIMTAVFLAWMSFSLTGCAGGENGDKESDFPEEISKRPWSPSSLSIQERRRQ